ncbi:MAG: hypothetical protein RLZZ623_2038, partial [Actinomycetota bacterium]
MRDGFKLFGVVTLVATTLVTGAAISSADTSGTPSVTPTVVNSATTCTALVPSLPYSLPVSPGARAKTYALPGAGGGTVSIAPNDDEKFSWSATYPIDAVIVIGGGLSNVYRYNNALSDRWLAAPNPKKYSDLPDITSVWFCHDGLNGVSVTSGATTVKAARGVS